VTEHEALASRFKAQIDRTAEVRGVHEPEHELNTIDAHTLKMFPLSCKQ